ncbi:MAG: ATP synthase F1 subunit epsilon [Acidobacteriota bacterium]
MAEALHCSVVTPERAILESEAQFVAFPAHDGEIGVMPQRAPLLCRLGTGILRVKTTEGTHRFFIDGGFAQMVDNKLTLLTEQARAEDELERATVLEELQEARAMSVEGGGHDQRQAAIRRAQEQLKLTPERR